MTKKVLSIAFISAMVLLVISIPLFAEEENYHLAWGSAAGSGAKNPVYCRWDYSAAELLVTYINAGNYFGVTDINAVQYSKLLKADAGGVLREVSGVTSRIVSVGDSRVEVQPITAR